MIANVD